MDATGKVSYGQHRVLSIPTRAPVGRRGELREFVIGAIPLEEIDDKITRLLQVML